MDAADFEQNELTYMLKKIVIIGANGQLGSDLMRVLKQDKQRMVFPFTHKDIEIADKNSFVSVFDEIKPDGIINTAAFHNVEEAEIHPNIAFETNTIGVKNLAEYCEDRNCVFSTISTDYVFGLDNARHTPYQEIDTPGPLNIYGNSKLSGEHAVRSTCSRFYIIRTSGLFGNTGPSGKNGRNFIETILHLASQKDSVRVVNDQTMSPTYTLDLAKQIASFLSIDAYGTYHVSSEGSCTWYEMAKFIYFLLKIDTFLEPVLTSFSPSAVKRPRYSVLDKHCLRNLDISLMRGWKDMVTDYLKEKKYL
jgi:dTDP-4-dehydrorhamnose reductase